MQQVADQSILGCQLDGDRARRVASGVPHNTIDTEIKQIGRIAVGHHDVGNEAFIGLVWDRHLKEELPTQSVAQ